MGQWGHVTVTVRSHGVLVSEAHAPGEGVFAERVSPGNYVLSTPSHSFKSWTNVHHRRDSVVVRSGVQTMVTLKCFLKYPLG